MFGLGGRRGVIIEKLTAQHVVLKHGTSPTRILILA
jgi:hypothetical protein